VVNEPKRGIGATTIDRLRSYASDHGISFYDAVKEVDFTGVTPRAANALAKFNEMIQSFRKQQQFLNATKMVESVLERSGYKESLEKDGALEAQSRLENVDEYLTVTQHFDETTEEEEPTLIDFLTDLALIADIDEVDE